MGLEAVELGMELETEFNVSLDGMTLTTVGALFELIRVQLPPDTASLVRTYPDSEMWERYITVVTRVTGIPRDKLRPEASFSDLGLP